MDVKKLNMFMSILKFGLVALGVILCALIWFGPNMESTIEDQEAYRDGAKMGLAIGFTGFIIFASVGLILLFFVVQLITTPKKTIISIIGLFAALVLYLIFVMIGTGDTNETLNLTVETQVDQGTIVSSSAGIFTVMSGLIIALLVVILGPFMGRFRK